MELYYMFRGEIKRQTKRDKEKVREKVRGSDIVT